MTHCGGCLSLLFRVLVLIYATLKVIRLVTKDDPDLTSTQKLVRLHGKAHVNVGEMGIDLMTSIYSPDPKTGTLTFHDVPADIGSLQLWNVNAKLLRLKVSKKATEIPRVNCDMKFAETPIGKKGLKKAACFDMTHERAIIGGESAYGDRYN